jgi:hypothetical protein
MGWRCKRACSKEGHHETQTEAIHGLGTLALLAGIQLLLLGFRGIHPASAPSRSLRVGETVSPLPLQAAGGEPVSFDRPTVLLVFDQRCAHSRAVSSSWTQWLRERDSGLRAIVVSADALDSARAFVKEQGWDADLAVVEREGALTRRTPWIYVVDVDGTVLAEGHGRRIAELTARLTKTPKGSEP